MLNLYVFDRELRLLVLDAIERVEVSVCGQWAYPPGRSGCSSPVFASLVLLFSDSSVALFLAEEAVTTRALASEFFSRLWPVFLLASVNLAISAYFNAIHLPLYATLLAFSRSLALPFVLLLLLFQGLPGASFLYALPLAELLTFGMALGLLWWRREGVGDRSANREPGTGLPRPNPPSPK